MRWTPTVGVLALVAAACGRWHFDAAGSPCSDTQPCRDGLVCAEATHTCEVPTDDASLSDVVPAATDNDGPGGAVDVTAGGTFTADLTSAHDDAAPGTD